MMEAPDIVARLARVEASLRQTQRLAAFLALALLVLFSVAAFQGPGAQGQGNPADLSVRNLTAQSVTIRPLENQDALTVSGKVLVKDTNAQSKNQTEITADAVTLNGAGYFTILSSHENAACLLMGGPKDHKGNFRQRVFLSVADKGASLRLCDAKGELRADLGAQTITTEGKTRRFPESKFTLWGETGQCLTSEGTK